MRNKGFTLIELLIVVAIIAILAAIAVPNFLEAQVRAKVSRNKNDLRSVATALESYAVDNNTKYPPPWDTDSPGAKVWGAFTEPPFHARVPNYLTTPVAYITSLPVDPFRAKDSGDSLGTWVKNFKDRFSYFNFPFNFVNASLAPPNVNNFTEAHKIAGYWLMYSVGPDRDEFNTPSGMTRLNQRVYRDYDPTNGTISPGNIYRTQASGEKLGTIPYFYTTP